MKKAKAPNIETLHWRFDVVHECYKIKASSKNAALDIFRNVFPVVDRENIFISQVSKESFDNMDCLELDEESVGEFKDRIV